LIEAQISVPLNPYNSYDGFFDLYYFVHKAAAGDSRKTVLFITGGPGEFVTPRNMSNTFADFLAFFEYNVVYFHVRGSGFSQIPPQSQYDKFLTTSYAVEDIEEIRRDLIRQKLLNDDGKWDAIIAWSYGTILAQKYTFAHQNSVDKLILFGPISRHNVASSARQFRDEPQNILRDDLEKIYTPLTTPDPETPDPRQKEFYDLTEAQKKQIFYTLFGGTDERGVFDPGVIERTESAFGSISFVADRYSRLRKTGELHRYNLEQYSCSFFKKLYDLRFYGWLGNSTAVNNQLDIAAKIRDEIIHPMKVGEDDCSDAESSSERVFYAMGTLDGINSRFLREWLANGRRDVRDALRKSAGDAHVKRGVNDYVEKLGIGDDEMIESSVDGLPALKTEWDPANYKHARPTLILKGEADPVTVAGQAEYFNSEALLGPRILIKFPGIGHAFELPDTDFQQRLDGMIKLDEKRFSPLEVSEVRGTINGLKLNRNLHLKLFPPHDLEQGLRLVGFGRVAGNAPNGRGDDIVALIKNTHWNEVRGSKRMWKLDSNFFIGKVELDPGILAAGETKAIYGKIIDPRQKEAYRVSVSAPNDWDLSIKTLCSLSQKEERALPVEARWTLQPEKDFEACLLSREDLSKALAQQIQCDLPILVQPGNTSDSSQKTEKNWKIVENPMFTATISSRLESCTPDGDPRVVAGVAALTLTDWLKIREPPISSNSNGFELLAYNVLEDGRISLVLRNRDQFNSKYVEEKGRDWSFSLIAYRPGSKGERAPCAPLASLLSTRSCLIYSFLVMDPVQFIDYPTNVVLQDIVGRLKMETKVDAEKMFDPRTGGIRIPGLKE